MQKWMKFTVITLGVLILMGVSAIAGMKFTSRPAFCTNCHIMKPAVEAWATMPHKEVTCLDCHAEPGTIGYVKQKMKGLGELYKYVSKDYDGKFEVKFNNDICISCHSKDSQVEKAKDITATQGARATSVPHQDIYNAKIPCLTCHQSVVHGGENPKAKDDTSSCLVCHGKTSPAEKAKDVTAVDGTRAPGYPHQPLIDAKTSCLACHGKDHKAMKEAKVDQTQVCLTCHSSKGSSDKIKDITATQGPRMAVFAHTDIVKSKTSCLGMCHLEAHGKK